MIVRVLHTIKFSFSFSVLKWLFFQNSCNLEKSRYSSQNPLSPYVHVQSVTKLKLGHRKEAVGSPKRSSLMSGTHELNISDEFSLVLSFAEKERIT
jgi:hypothetical protein